MSKKDEFQKEIDDFFRYMPRLSPSKESLARLLYGIPNELPIEHDPIDPPSPRTTMTKAAEYVLHLKKKGMLKITAEKPDDVFTRFYQYKRMFQHEPQQVEIVEAPKSISLEEYQYFWHLTETVQTYKKEIARLPYIDTIYQSHALDKFEDYVSSIVRIMKHDGKLDAPKTRQSLNSTMKFFVLSVVDARKRLISEFLESKRIIYEKLTPETASEFIDYAPKQEKKAEEVVQKVRSETKKSDEIENRILSQLCDTVNLFPPSYRGAIPVLSGEMKIDQPSIINSIENSIKDPYLSSRPKNRASTVPCETRFINPVLTKPKSKPRILMSQTSHGSRPGNNNSRNSPLINTFSQNESREAYWRLNDPLKYDRMGTFNCPLTKISELCSDMSYNISPIEEIDGSLPQAVEDIPNPKSNVFVIDSKEPHDAYITPKQSRVRTPRQIDKREEKRSKMNEHLAAVIKAQANGEQKIGYSTNSSGKRDMDYLLEQSVLISTDNSGDSIHKRLDEIWSKLGFSIHQKLDMVVKYSQTIEESNRLSEALDFWEKAFHSVTRYDSLYKQIKDFLRIEMGFFDPKNSTYNQLLEDLKNSEIVVLQVSNQMKSVFGDELILNRKPVDTLILDRRKKLELLITHL